ncbi:DNA polymerase IV [Caulobacter vibrioides]|uniref:DNA polymerase IV n=1 Tax=Caulobacter vibrioides (strain NA1000 / CB15N) TaxID=565050 RepID=A0A0H3CAY0_CAUVN|nr:DNA polymerase IV [Caulobacter vibrioides]YP_002517923.1 DNA polymerase IV-kappa DinB [Caulobacter vibrioides NA1000]AAK24437.1 DNA-damage-inducible protein P [Caulobacter vibrioides CB15]ACL96015.1 DNA polymerase IV-kappa DinB [Caulobacter vibrioides NA1000]ATC29318.1 DNA polymerase IV [Caulobacter vibrioides]QXZ50830.1 DNA polymerase IV [Caulobacter vibrioides]
MKSLCRDCGWTGATKVARCPACASPRTVFHEELGTLSIAHMDCDAFYASVEKRDDPSLRDLPVIIGGGKRGVVTTACYIARMSGAKSAMPMFKALKLCPDAVVIKPNFAKYKEESRRIHEKLDRLTPLIQPLSLDEAWIDLTGTERLHGATPAQMLARLQAEIERDIGLTVSVGLAPNKFLAKIASELDKPRGFSAIGAAEAQSFLANKPVNILPGVGPATVASLAEIGLRTVGDIAAADLKLLANRLGSGGMRLHRLAHGQDSRIVDPDQARKTISAETTFNDDLHKREDLEDELWPLCEKVAKQARQEGVAGRVATLKLRTPDFKIHTRRRTLAVPTQTARTLFQVARELLSAEPRGLAYRLIGAGLTEFVDADTAGADMFADEERRALKSETAIDALRGKFGAAAVVTGRALKGR